MIKDYKFSSVLSVPIEGFIKEKRAVGYKFEKGFQLLKHFDSFVCSQGIKDTNLTKQLVLKWTTHKPNETISTQSRRISLLRGLAEYMNRIGYPAYVYPQAMITVERYAYVPYIFSSDEIKRIFDECDRFLPNNCTPNRHLILPLLMRILYGCGLRISEALNLTIQDVDLNKGTLHIRHTKFNKERILPMADSLKKRCLNYYTTAQIGLMGNHFFFPSPFGGNYSESTIYNLFRTVLRQAGISHLGRGKGPRLHDFRHAFAINCLRKWVLEGKNLNSCLHYLSAYLGHEDLRGSQRYLRLTAYLYPDITRKVAESCAYTIPEVELYEAD